MSDTILKAALHQSSTDPYLRLGPPAPIPGWTYRDFPPMPVDVWLKLIDLLGDDDIQMVAANSRQLPPASMCRAQLWISPAAQSRLAAYMESVP